MVRVTPFLPLLTAAGTSLFAPTATATATATSSSRQESYASLKSTHAFKRAGLLTCQQTYGADWIVCGDADSTFCYNPAEGQTCCAQDAGYCDAGTWCAPVAGFCCLDGEDVGTCAREAGFEVPTSAATSGGAIDTTVSSTTTTTRTSQTTVTASRTTSTTRSASSSSSSSPSVGSVQGVTSCTGVGGLTWSSIYSPTATGLGGAQLNGTRGGTNATAALPSPSYVQISDAKKEQWSFVWMTVAMGAVGLFMASC